MADRDVRVLLFNVWQLPSWLTDNRSPERATSLSPHLDEYDIVVLNEAFVNKDRLLSRTNFPVKHHLERECCSVFDSGLLILSRYPVEAVEREHFRCRTNWDKYAAKGILLCRIRMPDGTALNVVGTHMQAYNRPIDQRARASQAEQVATFIRRHCPSRESDNILFLGDLNMGPCADKTYTRHSEHYSDREDARLRSAAYDAMVSGAELQELPSEVADEDITRTLVRGPIAPRVQRAPCAIPGGLSDSGPIVLIISAVRAAGGATAAVVQSDSDATSGTLITPLIGHGGESGARPPALAATGTSPP